jgi:protein-tyrosine phosphatase
VDLTMPEDGLAPYEPQLLALATVRGADIVIDRLPIVDMGTCDVAHMRRILDVIDIRLAEGRTVYVHCWGGVGRTGTVIGCWLVRHGRTGEQALAEVSRLFTTMSADKRRRHAATGSPQTGAQRAMVRTWDLEDHR